MENSKPNYYAVIPAEVRYSDKLTDFEKLLYGEVSAMANVKGYCFARNSYFGELFGKSIRTITRAISNLSAEGFIEVEVKRDDSGEVIERRVYLSLNVDRSRQKFPDPMDENTLAPPVKNGEYNNTSSNTTSINTKGEQGSLFSESNKATTFEDSPVRDLKVWRSQLQKEADLGIDVDYYFGVVRDWSLTLDPRTKKAKRTPRGWVATARQIIRRESNEGKLKTTVAKNEETNKAMQDYLNL